MSLDILLYIVVTMFGLSVIPLYIFCKGTFPIISLSFLTFPEPVDNCIESVYLLAIDASVRNVFSDCCYI